MITKICKQLKTKTNTNKQQWNITIFDKNINRTSLTVRQKEKPGLTVPPAFGPGVFNLTITARAEELIRGVGTVNEAVAVKGAVYAGAVRAHPLVVAVAGGFD